MRSRLLTCAFALCLLVATVASAAAGDRELSFRQCLMNSNTIGCDQGRFLYTNITTAVSPDGRHVYVAAERQPSGGSLQVIDRDPQTGDLTSRTSPADCYVSVEMDACTLVRMRYGPTGVVVSPDGRHVYEASFGSRVAVFARDATSGRLTQPSGTAGCIGRYYDSECRHARAITEPVGLSISPDGRNLYVFARGPYDRPGRYDDGSIVTLEIQEDGSLEQLPGRAGCVTAGGRNGGLEDGDCTPSPLGAGQRLSISPDGRHAYATAYPNGILLFDRDPASGELTPKSGLDACISADGSPTAAGDERCVAEPRLAGRAEDWLTARDILISPDGNTVYALGDGDGDGDAAIVVFDRDPASGLLAFRSCVNEPGDQGCEDGRLVGGIRAGAISPDGGTLVSSGRGLTLFDIDPDGGLVQRSGVEGCASVDGLANDGSECQRVPLVGSAELVFGSNEVLHAVGGEGISTFGPRVQEAGTPPPPAPQAPRPPVVRKRPARSLALRIAVRVKASWSVNGAVSTPTALRATVPPKANVEVRCLASTCPFRSRSTTAPLDGELDALRLIGSSLVLHARQMIEIRITAPGMTGKAVRYRARRGRTPRATVRALPLN